MTDTHIDPAATPEDEDAPEIAADDAGASAFAEHAGKQAEDHEIREGMIGEGEEGDEEGGMIGEGA